MKRKVILALIVLILCPIVFGALSGIFPKRYTSAVGILVEQRVRALDSGNPLAAIDDLINASSASTPQTQLEIITGNKVLGKAVEEITPKFPQEFPDQETRSDKIQKLVNRLRVDVSKDSNVISLRVTSENPDLSSEMANAISRAYLAETKTMAEESGQAALTAIQKQRAETEAKLKKIDGDVAKLKEGLGVSDPQIGASSDSGTLSALELRRSNIEGELDGARAELTNQQATLNTTPRTMKLGEGTQLNPQLTEVEAQLSRSRAILEGLRARYYDDHPSVADALQQVRVWEAEKSKLVTSIKVREDVGPNPNYTQQIQVVNALKGRVQNLQNQLIEVNSALGRTKTRLGKYAELESELSSLIRSRTIFESNYAQLVQRESFVEGMGRARSVNANITSPALPMSQPSFPDVRLFTLMGFGLGVVLAALIIMPKAPVEAYATAVTAQDRNALSGDKPGTLNPNEGGASALGSGPSGPNQPGA